MNDQQDKESICVLSIIQKIKDGQFDPKLLDKGDRQQCVEVFMGEGYSKAQMAQILNCSEKTIKRDTDDIFSNNSLTLDEGLQKKIIGQFSMTVVAAREHLMRLARKADASVAERAQAEYLAFKVFTEYIEKLQSLGYLPLSSKAIVGDIALHINNSGDKSFDDLKDELIEIEKVIESGGEVPLKTKQEIEQIKQDIDKAKIICQLQKLSSDKKEDKNEPNSSK